MQAALSTITSISTDTIILLVLIALGMFAALKLGASRVVSMMIAIFVATVIFTNAFFIEHLTVLSGTSVQTTFNQLAIFLLITVPAYILLNRHIVADLGWGGKRYARAALLSIALTGLIMTVFYHFVPIEPLYDFSDKTDKLFEGDTAQAIWLLLPLLALFI